MPKYTTTRQKLAVVKKMIKFIDENNMKDAVFAREAGLSSGSVSHYRATDFLPSEKVFNKINDYIDNYNKPKILAADKSTVQEVISPELGRQLIELHKKINDLKNQQDKILDTLFTVHNLIVTGSEKPKKRNLLGL